MDREIAPKTQGLGAGFKAGRLASHEVALLVLIPLFGIVPNVSLIAIYFICLEIIHIKEDIVKLLDRPLYFLLIYLHVLIVQYAGKEIAAHIRQYLIFSEYVKGVYRMLEIVKQLILIE